MKTTITLATIALLSMAGNAYFLNNAHNISLRLDACARDNNVYKCKVDFTPKEAPRIVTVQAALLPPPAFN